jgi:hypothetical protein
LDARDTQQYNYDQPANMHHNESFKFPDLNDKIGLFIIEFVGNGLCARAVVKKGSLQIITKSTIAGHLIYLLDHNK